MKRNNFLICVMVLCSFYTLRAELLIVQKGDDGRFIPLPAASGERDSIRFVLERYQWPQCIINGSKMNKKEQVRLLSFGPEHAYAQERFIQSKLEKIYASYQVVFVPTTLYELFCIVDIVKTKKEKNPLQQEIKKMKIARPKEEDQTYKINLKLTIDKSDSPARSMSEVYGKYDKINRLFFTSGSWGYINNKFVQFLFSEYLELSGSEDAFTMSEIIKNKSKSIATLLLEQLSDLYDSAEHPDSEVSIDLWPADSEVPIGLWPDRFFLLRAAKDNPEQFLDIIGRVIDLEYAARTLNSELLLRGSSFEHLPVGWGVNPKRVLLAGSTVFQEEEEADEKERTVEQMYGKKKIIPFSISFGNSLFAGAINDPTASVYYFLMGGRVYGEKKFSPKRSVGYALFIDKKAYIEHRIHRLFFIAPLMTLAALLEEGEYFHSRTTAAVFAKGGDEIDIQGLLRDDLADPSGVLLITRDPLRHAELFSQYLARHGRILQAGSLDELTEEEQKFAQEVLKSQKEAAQFYKTTRDFKRAVDRKAQRIRRRSRKALVEPRRGGKRTAPVAEEEVLPKRIKIEQERIREKQEKKEEVQESEVMKEEEEMEEGEDE